VHPGVVYWVVLHLGLEKGQVVCELRALMQLSGVTWVQGWVLAKEEVLLHHVGVAVWAQGGWVRGVSCVLKLMEVVVLA